MINTINDGKYLWLDVSDPSTDDMNHLAATYNLHPAALQDCMQPEHLPKYELIDDTHFIITRYYDSGCAKDADSIQSISRKLAIFCNGKFLITIHRQVFDSNHELFHQAKEISIFDLLYKLIKLSLHTFEAPVSKLDKDIDFYESRIFLKKKIPDLLKSLYLIKRRTYVIRKLMNLTKETIEKIALSNKNKSVVYEDMKDYYIKLDTQIEEVYDSIISLLSIYISISSQRTNDVMRVLTVFSAFFLPLTFLVGVYGMNFKYMPELEQPLAYPLIWGFMVTLTIVIYAWFKRKGWI